MNRRLFLLAAGAATVSSPWWLTSGGLGVAPASATAALSDVHANWPQLLPAGVTPPSVDSPLSVTEAQWRQQLDSAAFRVLFEDGTERPGSSPLDDEKRDGIFACAACDLPLFSSAMKYDSGTGWPSFFTAIPGHLATSKDYKLIVPRTEYHCIRCGGHQGHRFSDGPAPTSERWCNNGVALTFLAV